MGRLTTHVLDTSLGRPAAGLSIALYGLDSGQSAPLCEVVTNDDGRCDAPLLEDGSFVPGSYRLVFQSGAYFDSLGIALPEPKFLDEIVIQFGISESQAHYHVPLLLSPYGYSTYRGS